MSLQMTMTIQGADRIARMLAALPAEVVSKRGGPVKNALRRGARVIQKQQIANLRATLTDSDQTTDLLAKNIIVSRGKAPTVGKGERFLVRIRRKTYPGRTGEPVTTLKTAQLKEYGSERQTAEPFIRPAVAQKAAEAINVTTASLLADLEKIAKRLAQQGGA